MSIYLTSFYPLCCTKKGRDAITTFKFPKYIDGSCRREPDFENKYPAITGLCRPGFAAKLKKGDIVIYSTNVKGVGARKIVCVLQIKDDLLEDHDAAAQWYKDQDFVIPNNIMVSETEPFQLNQTAQLGGWTNWVPGSNNLDDWNSDYQKRADWSPKVAICDKLYENFNDPIIFKKEEMFRIFGRRPGTRNPSKVKLEEWEEIKKIIAI